MIDTAICRRQCDIVLKNARYADVFGGRILKGDICISGDKIVGVGAYSGKVEYDLSGKVVLPAFIDAHVHIESSQLSPQGFASLVVPHGTVAVIADPHEITNVCGIDGAKFIYEAGKTTPLDVKVMLPSCVPATPFETSGAVLDAEDIKKYIGEDFIFGLGEFMNCPAVVAGDSQALAKLEAANAVGKICDGHAPALTGEALNAYICGGIATDHECISPAEISEKVSKGMYVMLRHGSSARNLRENCRCVTPSNFRRFLICTDDRHAADLYEKGGIDDALRTLVACGINPVRAVTCATLNTAECYGLKGRGAIAPAYFADLAVVDDLKDFNVTMVFKDGKLVAKDGKPLFSAECNPPEKLLNTVHIPQLTPSGFVLKLKGERAKAITLNGGSIVTGCEIVTVKSEDGDVCVKGTDLLKLAVVERHGKTGNIGKGLVKDYGFKGGAMGLTVSHDSHNLIILGDDNAAMAEVANALSKCGGGMALCDKSTGKVTAVPLEIGGLMTAENPEKFIKLSSALYESAYAMGVKKEFDAFMSLAFLSLAVVPSLKLLDTGLFDVNAFAFTEVDA